MPKRSAFEEERLEIQKIIKEDFDRVSNLRETCSTCGRDIAFTDAYDANGFIFCLLCWLGLDRLGDIWFANKRTRQQFYVVTGPLLQGENPDSQNIPADSGVVTVSTDAQVVTIPSTDTDAEMPDANSNAPDIDVAPPTADADLPWDHSDAPEAVAELPYVHSDAPVVHVAPPDADSGMPDIDTDDLVVDKAPPDAGTDDPVVDEAPPDAVTDDPAVDEAPTEADTVTQAESVQPEEPDIQDAPEPDPFENMDYWDPSGLDTYEQEDLPSPATHDAMDHRERLPPIDEMLACPLPCIREALADVPMGCLRVCLKIGPHNVLNALQIRKRDETKIIMLTGSSRCLDCDIALQIAPVVGDRNTHVFNLLSWFGVQTFSRTQETPEALKHICELTMLIGGVKNHFFGHHYVPKGDVLPELPSNTDTGSTIVMGTLGLIRAACASWHALCDVTDDIVKNVQLAVVNTKMQQAEAQKAPTIFCCFTNNENDPQIYGIVRSEKHCQ